jgi:putative peptidoglycan lipid II flippase
MLLATLLMVIAVGGGWFLLRGVHGADLLAVVLLIPLGIAVYGAALWALKIEGTEELAAVWTKLRGRFS